MAADCVYSVLPQIWECYCDSRENLVSEMSYIVKQLFSMDDSIIRVYAIHPTQGRKCHGLCYAYAVGGVGTLEWLMVPIESRNQGVGMRLFTAAEKELINRDCHMITFDVCLHNSVAWQFCNKVAYKLGYELDLIYPKAWYGKPFAIYSKTIG